MSSSEIQTLVETLHAVQRRIEVDESSANGDERS